MWISGGIVVLSVVGCAGEQNNHSVLIHTRKFGPRPLGALGLPIVDEMIRRHALLLFFHHATAQQCAVCFAGNAVGLMQPHVRRFAKERLVDALGCAAVDSFFYLTLDNTQQRDDLLPAPNATVEAVHGAAREFDPVSVTVRVRDDALGDDEGGAAHAQLSKAAACYSLVEASELAARKRYDG